ncbi:MAG: hypothetical protein H3Z53_07015 [archaeon]|nr:hypothetical protein [archaeon]MCP8314103.1 hypothetical protein [archaeon]MCP8318009.1 hypothetical protein [archaeon]
MSKVTEFEHIAHAIVAKRHPPLYLMHIFRARKSHNVVAEYIRHYSKKGEIVFDVQNNSTHP